MKKTFNWKELEDSLFEAFSRALQTLGQEHGSEVFYAVALHQVSRELDGSLPLPLLAANTVSAGVEDEAGDFWSERWSPAEWAHDELDLPEEPCLRLEGELTRYATLGSAAHWRRAEARYFKVLTRVTRRLRNVAPELLAVSPDFITYLHDVDGGTALARKTIPKRRFEALFSSSLRAAAERRAVVKQPPPEQASFLVTRFEGSESGVTSEFAQEQLLTLGDEALPALLSIVDHDRVGWVAARLLGSIGTATPEVLSALRNKAPESPWHAMALGMLGDEQWLAEQVAQVAVLGLTAPLRAITTMGRRPPVDYQPLEGYLERANAEGQALAEKTLAPGSSYVRIDARDVDEALRGLESRHAVVRWHAAALLGERSLGKAAGKQILPALAEALKDEHALVRRLAALAISYWKAAAKPYERAIGALEDDPDESVRNIVRYVLHS